MIHKNKSRKIFSKITSSDLFDSQNDNRITKLYIESSLFVCHCLTLPCFWEYLFFYLILRDVFQKSSNVSRWRSINSFTEWCSCCIAQVLDNGTDVDSIDIQLMMYTQSFPCSMDNQPLQLSHVVWRKENNLQW